MTLNTFKKAQWLRSLEVSDDEPLPRMPLARQTGLVVCYPDRAYADHKGLTFLGHLRRYLPNAEYHEALPARMMECCREMRNRVSVEHPAPLEITGSLELGEQTLRFRVVSLPWTRPRHDAPVLLLLNLI